MDWTGKKVKIVLRDGFTKYGRLLEQDANFVVLEHNHGGGREQIAVSEIVAIKEEIA